MIRPLRLADAVTIAFVRARGVSRELTAPTWPKTPPESREPGFLDLALRAVLPLPRERPIAVSVTDRRLDGFVMAVRRASGLVWDVEYLRAEDDETGTMLLRWVCERASSLTSTPGGNVPRSRVQARWRMRPASTSTSKASPTSTSISPVASAYFPRMPASMTAV